MNDTHPTVAVAELMRILVDEEHLSWDDAWDITTRCVAYTNHTIMAEALEKWPIEIFQRLLPRVYQIVDEINRRFVIQINERYPGNEDKVRKMAILYDGQVKMANMAIVAGYSVNGVAYLHTEILKNTELNNFYKLYPEKFNNKTNGITFRRWLMSCNPELSAYITELIGEGWKKDANELEKLGNFINDDTVLTKLVDIKNAKKTELASYLKKTQ
ncbi:glycogen/starch/alpha-glucan phosphorylase, partial [Fusobacterium varium]|uniref:glycogen/starch/alpha-glucan phosphorylase n=1 Tax=Fusobacterium varium TaxID=856 RepID=UPI0032C11A81